VRAGEYGRQFPEKGRENAKAVWDLANEGKIRPRVHAELPLAAWRDAFDLLDGFDEDLGVDLNDVDFCLRSAAKGFRTVYEPAAELIHHESPSRGTAGGVGDIVKFVDRWKDYITEGDRYLSAHLTRADPSCGLARPEEEDAWNTWHATLTTQ